MSSCAVVLSASLVWLAAIVSPGPGFLVVSRLAVSHSRSAAVGAAFGMAVASLVYATLTMFGLSILMLRVAWFGDLVRLLGGVYLIWLGIQAWRTGEEEQDSGPTGSMMTKGGIQRGIRIGLLTEITNPKSIAFFLSLFAATIPATTPLQWKLAILPIGGVMQVAWYTVVAFALSSDPIRSAYQHVRREMDRALGAVLIVLGAKVALDAT
jgi:threonine/homoserine/homoserine lactone efflux protein